MKFVMGLIVLLTFAACASLEKPVETTSQETVVAKEVAYGGNCGMGLCRKKIVKGNPQYNVEYKGKVYHFSSAKAQAEFVSKIDENIMKADKHWEAVGAAQK